MNLKMENKAFLLAVKAYIERVEVKIDNEWGDCRDLEELISDGEMPALYTEVLEKLEKSPNANSASLILIRTESEMQYAKKLTRWEPNAEAARLMNHAFNLGMDAKAAEIKAPLGLGAA